MSLPPSLDLKRILNVRDALQTHLFDGGLIDFFVGQRQYRINPVSFEMKGGDVVLKTTNPLMQLRGGVWRPARNQSLTLKLNDTAPVILVHGEPDELLLVLVSNETEEGPVQVVLYPFGVDLQNPKIQISGWSRGAPPNLHKKP